MNCLKKPNIINKLQFDVKNPANAFIAMSPGRRDVLDFITENIQKGIVVLNGLDGIGKSELARKFISEHEKDYDDIIWINAETCETVQESIQRAMKTLNMNTFAVDGEQKSTKSIIEDLYDYVINNGKSLFIFDNAETYYETEVFLPCTPSNNDIHILVTSPNNSEWKSIRRCIKKIQLDDFTCNEAIQFVKIALNIKNNSQLIEIINFVQKLHKFPLALNQAISYIQNMDKKLKLRGQKFEIKDYLEKFEQMPKVMLNINSPIQKDTIFDILQITINKIAKNKHGRQAIEILDIMSYLSNCIPEKTFLYLTNDCIELIQIVGLLKRYSIVRIDQGRLIIHGLIQQVRRFDLQSRDEEESVLGKIIKSIALVRQTEL